MSGLVSLNTVESFEFPIIVRSKRLAEICLSSSLKL